ncbi:MAG: hypothetical protein IAC51_09045 [bacterium]|uniref:Uncharacterized protein n=1 Tax=Candidatus Aphodosoma intestinipullorum TaxID=2840674 RepID=A0A940DL38_9BACT|nr:hypothetical protein [Candidatus Aphodosoma intestinipullorum]
MKKTILSLLLTLAAFIVAPAQETSAHLKFKGVPIDGTLAEFVSNMKKVGFTHIVTLDENALLTGDFAGFKECTIVVYSTPQPQEKVHTVAVIFPGHDDWPSLQRDYETLKSMLSEKYGGPAECVETFHRDSYTPRSNSDKLYELKMNECTWVSTYTLPEGDIYLSIASNDLLSTFVILGYIDWKNTEAVKDKAMDDI